MPSAAVVAGALRVKGIVEQVKLRPVISQLLLYTHYRNSLEDLANNDIYGQLQHSWVKVFRIIPDFIIFRLFVPVKGIGQLLFQD